MKAPRDLILGMYAQMTARNDIIYIHLHSLVIKGHKRSQTVTKRSPEVKNQTHHTETQFFACILVINIRLYTHDIGFVVVIITI